MIENLKHTELPDRKLVASRLSIINNFAFVFLVSGIFGLLVGVFYATRQDAVAVAQIISGVVEYPQLTIGYMIMRRFWCILNQICAIFLYLGASELILSYVVSGLLCMISFQALSLITLAISGNGLVSIATTFLIFVTTASDFTLNYPILFVFPRTWGVLGLAFTVFVVAVIGNRKYKLGSFLVGVAPALHGVFGLSLWLVMGVSLLCDYKILRKYLRGIVKYFLLGCLVFAFSLLFHKLTSPPIPKVPKEVASEYLKVFVQVWDVHRKPVDFTSVGMSLNIAGLMVSLLWLKMFGQKLSENVRILLRSFVIFAVLGMIFSALTWAPQQYVPDIIISMMMQRFVNFNILCFVALLIGLLSYYKTEFGMQLTLAGVLVILVLLILGVLPRYFLLIAMFGGAATLIGLKLVTKPEKILPAKDNNIPIAIRAGIVCVLIFSIGLSIFKIYPPAIKHIKYRVPDRKNHMFWNMLSKGKGVILTPMAEQEQLVQLMTRRPVFLTTELIDVISYVPAMGPLIDKAVKEVYGIELLNPPKITVLTGQHPIALNQAVWETRSAEQWRQIRNKYGITDILTYANWKLKLPVVLSDGKYIIYRIPAE